MVKNLMYLTILTFVVILVWIGLSVYSNFNPPVATEGITVNPIEPKFDVSAIESLKKRQVVPANFSESFIGSGTASVRSTITPAQTSTVSGLLQVSTTPTASATGSLSATPSL